MGAVGACVRSEFLLTLTTVRPTVMRYPTQHKPARSGRQWQILLLLLLALTGCRTSSTVAPYVVVREAQLRTERSTNDRLVLPLREKDKTRLSEFLAAGGNTQLTDDAIADPSAARRYLPLITRLTRRVTFDELMSPDLKHYFAKGPVYQVIDARESFPLSDTQVVALSDGTYWWIFFHPHSKLMERLLVTRAIGTRPSN